MQIIHKIDNFLYTIFPSVTQGDHQSLLNAIRDFYTYGPYKPKVTIDNEWVKIEIDTPTILDQETDYQKVISFCEKGKYADAKPILKNLISKNPTISEYHRIMGQILSDEDDQEQAINCLIDALRWDSKNGWALLMMGNIFAKFKDDVPTAMKYYDQALVANPKDNITINNIGANLMQQGKLEEAKKYFWEAIKINDKYPNTHFALGMIAEMEADLQSAFYSVIQAIKLNKNKDILYQNSVKQAFEIAQKIIATEAGKKIFREYRHKLEFDGVVYTDFKLKVVIPKDLHGMIREKGTQFYKRHGLVENAMKTKYRKHPAWFQLDPKQAPVAVIYDMPSTLTGIDDAIEMILQKGFQGRTKIQEVIEQRELNNFRRVLQMQIDKSPFAQATVEIIDEF